MTNPTASAPPARGGAPASAPQPSLRRLRLSAVRARRTPAGAYAGSVALHLLGVVVAVAFLRIGPETGGGAVPAPVREQVEYFDLVFPGELAGGPLPDGSAPGAGIGEPAPPSNAEALPADPTAGDPRRRDRDRAGEGLTFPSRAPSGLPPVPSGGGAGPAGGERAAPGTGAGAAGGTGGNPLRPGLRDPRLHAPEHPPAESNPTDHERYMARLHGKLQEYNDSIMGEQERARKATDWTVTDKDGKRWGVSPGKVHLGDVTIPNPFGVPNNAPQRADEAREEARQRREIDRQVGEAERRNTFNDRVKATRERKDAERKEKKGGTE